MTQATASHAKLPRVFRYNNIELEDPGLEHDAVDVRNLYSATYPEIVSAAIEGPELKDGKRVYTFRRAVGTKGYNFVPRPAARKAFPKLVGGVEVKRCAGCTVDKPLTAFTKGTGPAGLHRHCRECLKAWRARKAA